MDGSLIVQIQIAGYIFGSEQLFQGNAEISQFAEFEFVQHILEPGREGFFTYGGIESDAAADNEKALIPTGSGNDLARDMRLGKEPLKILNAILNKDMSRRMDLGKLSINSHADTSVMPEK